MEKESPEYLRTSLAAAMTLGFKNGWFYRNARLPCINLLLTYSSGCIGNCGYCGLQMRRPGNYKDKSFIRVEWPVYKLTDIIQKISEKEDKIKRICLSMITNKRAIKDTSDITGTLRWNLDIPVSLLISPTILKKNDFYNFFNSGADKIGIAVDCATPQLFGKIRGKSVKGPHKWNRYWKCYKEALEIFGKGNVGVHLIAGLGETEKEMINTIQKVYDLGGETHLFSFFPEGESLLANHPMPPIGQYRRVQLARYLIDEGIKRYEDFNFDDSGKLTGFGMTMESLYDYIKIGKPFMTSGCVGKDGEIACNRPYADCLPGPEIRNYPFLPDGKDIKQIMTEIWQ